MIPIYFLFFSVYDGAILRLLVILASPALPFARMLFFSNPNFFHSLPQLTLNLSIFTISTIFTIFLQTRNKKDAASALPSTDNEKEKPAIKMMTAARAQELKEQSQAEHALRRQQQEKEREEKQKEKEEKEENNAAGWGGQVQTAVMENRIVVFFMGDSTWSLVAAWGVVLAALIAVLIGTYSLVLENKE